MLKVGFLFVLTAFFVCLSYENNACTPETCSYIDCNLKIAETCKGRVDMKGGYCGCCPICIRQLQEGQPCGHLRRNFRLPKRWECEPGTTCDSTTKLCKKLLPKPCELELAEKTSSSFDEKTLPSCNEDGFYDAKQCRGSFCFCASANGSPISGYEANVIHFSKMSCQCARDKVELTDEEANYRKMSCDQFGNYKPRQCFDGICICVDRFGKPIKGYKTDKSLSAAMSCECARRNSDAFIDDLQCTPSGCDQFGNYVQPPSNGGSC